MAPIGQFVRFDLKGGDSAATHYLNASERDVHIWAPHLREEGIKAGGKGSRKRRQVVTLVAGLW